jgi:dipeptidyl aminopeptidase/acylaminoacyl peptidase
MNRLRIVSSLAAVFLTILSAPHALSAQGGAATAAASAGSKPKRWTPEDMVFVDIADQFRISPDEKWTLWVKTTPDIAKDGRATNLMLSSLEDSREIPLTRDFNDVSQPRWSPDGTRIAFISGHALPGASASGAPHIWLISLSGGEPWPAATIDSRVRHFEWQNDDTIIFSAPEDPSFNESQIQAKKDDSIVVDDDTHMPPVRLFRLLLKEQTVTRITDNDRWIDSLEISPDKKWAVAQENLESSYQWDRKVPPAFWLVNLDTGERKRIFTENNVHPRLVRWAADNSGIYAIAPYSSIMAEPSGFARLVYFYDVASGKTLDVNLDWEKGVGFTQKFEITPDGFMVLLADGVRFKPARYIRNGTTWSHEWIEGEQDQSYFDFTLGPDGHALIYEYSTASIPPKWYRAKLDGAKVVDPAPLVDVYARFRDRVTPRSEVIHWTGSNNDQVDGILYYPDNYEPGKRYPLVTYTHGGPMGADLDAWAANPAYVPNLLTQRGAFILETNYHGSANYGAKWAESICCGKYYELEIPDIEKGVDNLIAKGLVDPDRIGAFGWSNGAILSIALDVDDPARYKAAVVGAGDVDYVSDWGNSEFGEAFDAFYFGKAMPDDPQFYIQKSPLYHLDRVRTPTLIMQGSEDNNVPTEQGWLQYRTLYYLQKAPVRFVLFPGEGHFPMKLSHQLRVTQEELAWFDKYLFKTSTPKNEALKDGSPLAVTLEHPISRSGSLYGVERAAAGASKTILVPEVVQHGTLEIGRFEVTRAQFAAFDSNYKYQPGAGNFPASGVTYDQAKSYCAWLSRATGETYRLPDQDEAKILYAPRSEENTLDYWAGYKVNPDDAERLQAAIARIPADALIKPVGSFVGVAGDGEAAVFDLGGNVAEWTETPEGKGMLSGGSADRPADPKSSTNPSNPSFAGFRVVRVSAVAQ